MSLNKQQCFQILGFEEGIKFDKAKKIYLTLVKETHPDTGGTAEKFRKVQEAWEYFTKNFDSFTIEQTWTSAYPTPTNVIELKFNIDRTPLGKVDRNMYICKHLYDKESTIVCYVTDKTVDRADFCVVFEPRTVFPREVRRRGKVYIFRIGDWFY